MPNDKLKKLIEDFQAGIISKEKLYEILSKYSFIDLGHTKLDTSRKNRTDFPEVVYCPGKKLDEILKISKKLYEENGFALLTKAEKDVYERIKREIKDTIYEETAKIIKVGEGLPKTGLVSIISGGTSDIPIAEEAAITAETFGSNVRRFYDVGVAGLHRILSFTDEISCSNVIVAVAGMEGALPSVAAGLFNVPVIGVPTSVGYGINLKGIAPLLTMLNSCAPGVCVVNIDNGFGGGYLASLINKKIEDARRK